jgi:hypothetical protein
MDDLQEGGAAYLDTFRAPEIGGESEIEHDVLTPEQADAAGDPDAPEPIDKGAFWIVFKAGFAIPGGFFPDFAPLAIQPHEEPPARIASDSIHDLLGIYFPSALLPQSQTLALALGAAPFLLMKVAVVREIMRGRRLAMMQQRGAANINQAPTGGGGDGQGAGQGAAGQGGAYASPVDWMDAENAA